MAGPSALDALQRAVDTQNTRMQKICRRCVKFFVENSSGVLSYFITRAACIARRGRNGRDDSPLGTSLLKGLRRRLRLRSYGAISVYAHTTQRPEQRDAKMKCVVHPLHAKWLALMASDHNLENMNKTLREALLYELSCRKQEIEQAAAGSHLEQKETQAFQDIPNCCLSEEGMQFIDSIAVKYDKTAEEVLFWMLQDALLQTSTSADVEENMFESRACVTDTCTLFRDLGFCMP